MQILLHILAFLIGSIPIGFLLAKFEGIDIRTEGSGNVGATNVARSLGKRAGVITLIGDALKGAIGVSLAGFASSNGELLAPTLGLAAILGHCFSPFLKFKGGKGVATSLGVFLTLIPAQTGVVVVFFLLTVICSGYVSLGSILAAISMPIVAAWSVQGPQSRTLIFAATVTAIIITMRHRPNISRMLVGEESKFTKT